MDAQEIAEKGYTKHIRPFFTVPNVYTIEFWPKAGMQSREPDRPNPVPPAPRAVVEVRGEETSVRWDILPSSPEVSIEEFTAEAKRAIAKFRGQN